MPKRRFKVRPLILILVGLIITVPFGSVNSEEIVAKSQSRYHVELQELKKQMQQLQDQINMLEIQSQEVNQKLYDAMSAEKAVWTEKFEAGYKKGLYFKSKDGNWKMKFRIRGQFTALVRDQKDGLTRTNLSIARLRFKWNGNAFRPWFLYTVQIGAKDDVALRDMYFDIAYNKQIAPRVGQYKVPFGRQELTSSSVLQFVLRSIVNAEFGYGRDRGFGINGVAGQNFAYGAGVFNGAGRNDISLNSNLLWAGRTQFMWSNGGKLKYSGSSFVSGGDYQLIPNFTKVAGGVFTAGAGVAGIKINRNQDPKVPAGGIGRRMDELGTDVAQVTSITGDINYKHPRFNVQGSYYGRWISPEDIEGSTAFDQGFNVQAGLFVVPREWEIAGRFSYIKYDDGTDVVLGEGAARDRTYGLTGGLNYYISKDHRWKLQATYSYLNTEDEDGTETVADSIFQAQLQALF